ncbi:putative flavonol 3-O-glucosyltransferase [Helianthus anomalus]
MVRRVMVDEEGVEMRVRINDMKEMVKEAVGNSGSSQESLEGLVKFILSR